MIKNTTINAHEVITAIRAGEFDSVLSLLSAAVQFRRKVDQANKIYSFRKGDKVKFNSGVNPKYLVGTTAVITKVNVKRVVVDLELPVGRFVGKGINCPVSILDKVS